MYCTYMYHSSLLHKIKLKYFKIFAKYPKFYRNSGLKFWIFSSGFYTAEGEPLMFEIKILVGINFLCDVQLGDSILKADGVKRGMIDSGKK